MRARLIATAAATTAGVLLLASAAMAGQTGTAGGGAAIGNYQSSLVMTQSMQLQGIFPPRDPGGFAQDYLGTVHTFAGNFGPYGEPLANGQIFSIQQNTALFSVLGTTYGGNGVNNFAIPDLTGRVAIGAGQGPGLSNRVLGEDVGTASNVMTLGQLPDHDHTLPGGGVTGLTGGATPMNNMQPSLALSYGIAVGGVFPSQGGGSPGDTFLGQVGMFAGNFEPGGYMAANGQLLSIAENQALFAIIGTTYGGDGVQTFALPDLRGRTIVGVGGGVTLGESFGSEQTLLTEANLPHHDHSLPGGGVSDFTGGGAAYDNAEPSLGLNYLIALNGVFPSRDGGGGWTDPEATLGEIVAFAGNYAPGGYAFANGQILSIQQNTALFSILGTTYGGDGRTTFALPDLRGRTIMGAGAGFTVGDLLGERNTTLTVNQMAIHSHSLPDVSPGVPEPATWALMIGGFGMAGAALRRRRAATAA